ncbi:amino acid adenylation domain-containing protein [Virgisporangium aurantiacum]|nr:amino acid adenylation domain-containing protein [Virgisporangium aurantiacum]
MAIAPDAAVRPALRLPVPRDLVRATRRAAGEDPSEAARLVVTALSRVVGGGIRVTGDAATPPAPPPAPSTGAVVAGARAVVTVASAGPLSVEVLLTAHDASTGVDDLWRAWTGFVGELADLVGYRPAEPEPSTVDVVAAVTAAAAARPDSIAIEDDSDALTYGELVRFGDVLAGRFGAQPGGVVGILGEPGAAFFACQYAVLRSGAAFVPLDRRQPAHRLAQMVGQARCRFVISVAATADADADRLRQLAPGPEYLRWERLLVPTSQPPPPSRPAVPTIAYVMFTSGSTGVPKGAAIRRTSLACLAAWGRGLLDLGPDSTVGQLAGVGFDASIWEVWPAWTAGARVVVAPAHVRFDPPALLDWLGEARVDATFLATPLAEMVMTLDPPRSLRLRLLTVGGDRLRPVPGPLPYRVLNMYGPTECTVIATAGHVTPGAAAVPSIGVPLPYAYARVVGDDGTPTPDGEPGELWIGGQGVGAGYLFQPEESAARFVPDPYTDAGRIVYRTGDLVRRGVDGSFAFIGRLDRQVKLAGARIELGEIEAVAQRCAGIEVASAAVVGPPEERHLVVFAVLRAGHDADTVAADLRRRLPSQARGLRLRPVARLPLTGNGKVDRARLETELTAAARVQEGHVAGTDA